MAMFGKAKEQFEFVKKAREIQKKLKNEIITIESGAVTKIDVKSFFTRAPLSPKSSSIRLHSRLTPQSTWSTRSHRGSGQG